MIVSRFIVVASIGLASFAAAACSGGDGGGGAPATTADAGTLPGKGTTTTSPTPGKETPTGGKDAGAKPAPTGTGATCGALVACLGACPDEDEACSDGCAAKASPDAIEQISTLATCIEGSGCEDATCARAACAAEFAGCDGLD